MQVPVKRFFYPFYVHIKILVKVGVSLIAHNSCVTEKEQVLYMNYNLLDNDVNTEM